MPKRSVVILLVISLGSLGAGLAFAGVDRTRIPVGDGRQTTAGPKRGYIYACRVMSGGPGAQVKGPWFSADGTYDLTAKATVDGNVKRSGRVSIKVSGSRLRVSGNGLPAHGTGVFPIASSDDAYRYDRNPNSISAQSVSLSLPARPKVAGRAGCAGGRVGTAVNGVAIFSGVDAGGRDAVAWEVQDRCGGHPERTGTYHYHSIPDCLGTTGVVGYANDGFPILGVRENGRRLSNSDLDACHGHTHTIKLRGRTVRSYHYHATDEFPYTVGCFRGTPVRTGP